MNVYEYATALREPDGTIWDVWHHNGLNSGATTVKQALDLIAADPDGRDIVVLRRPIQAAWEIVPETSETEPTDS
jgi:hypothetical protein